MKNLRKIAVVLVCVMALSLLSSCKKANTAIGNMKTVSKLKPGDVYAEITFKDYEGKLTFILFEDIAPIGVKKFKEAANRQYYDGKTIHRVLNDMLIQGGALNPDGSDTNLPKDELFKVETSENARNFYGALCYAPDPSSGKNYRQFYIVTNNTPVSINKNMKKIEKYLEKTEETKANAKELTALKKRLKAMEETSKEVKERYSEQGGMPDFDGKVTVFGQLISGWELLEELEKAEVVEGNKLDDTNPSLGNGEGIPSRPVAPMFIDTVTITEVPKEEADDNQKDKNKKKKK